MDDVERQFLIEQYKQAGEEHRAEDRNTWQTFQIIFALNGVLFGFLGFESSDGSSFPSVIVSCGAGVLSSFAGVLIIGRSQRYQNYRILVAEEIQIRLSGERLYFQDSVDNALPDWRREHQLEPLELLNSDFGFVPGRRTMQWTLILVAVVWGLLFLVFMGVKTWVIFVSIGIAIGVLGTLVFQVSRRGSNPNS